MKASSHHPSDDGHLWALLSSAEGDPSRLKERVSQQNPAWVSRFSWSMERLIRPLCRSPYQDLFSTDVALAESLACGVVGQGPKVYAQVLCGARPMPVESVGNLGALLRESLHERHVLMLGRGPRPPKSYFVPHVGEPLPLPSSHEAQLWALLAALNGDLDRVDSAVEGLADASLGRSLWAFLRLQRPLCYPPFQESDDQNWSKVEALAAALIVRGQAHYERVLAAPETMPQADPGDGTGASFWMALDFVYAKRTGRGVVEPPERYFL